MHKRYDTTWNSFGNCIISQPVSIYGKDFNLAYTAEMIRHQPEFLEKGISGIYRPDCDITILSFAPATKGMKSDLENFDMRKWVYLYQKDIRKALISRGNLTYSKTFPKLMSDEDFHELEEKYEKRKI